MIVGQDWSSSDVLSREPPDCRVAELGYDENFRTNVNLDRLLKCHFNLTRDECYLTNLFPFIKRGKASAYVSPKLLAASAQRFTLPEIRIVSPQLVVCLGHKTFLALMRAVGCKGPPKMDMDLAINTPFEFANAMIYCVAHTGAFGTMNRDKKKGKGQVEMDWQELARRLNSA